jgi:hypothetical protein
VSEFFTAGEMAEHRADAESLMQETGTAYRPTGRSAQDPETGREAPIFDDVTGTDARCKIQGTSVIGRDTQFRTVDVGGQQLLVLEGGLHRPWDSVLMQPGDEWQISTTGPYSDPSLIGRRYRIVPAVNPGSAVPGSAKSFATARRYDVVELPPA